MNNSSSTSITSLVPGGVVTTQNISTVIKPKENNRSMQFVKIQTPELSKTAEEQIRVAQESKITKDKIKEVEEEWQSNLLNWKSKRRQQFVGTHSNDHRDEQNNNDPNENGRKIKTFAEMIEERSKTGNRLNFHLERYIGSSESDQDNSDHVDHVNKEISQLSLNNSNKNSNHIPYCTQQDNSTQASISMILKENEITKNGNNGGMLHSMHDGQGGCAADDEDENSFDDLVPINSTFKQGVEQPPTPPTIHSDDKIKLSLDVDTRTKEVSSAANYEDNASDHDDEEDEQEEEQKHLQRIAFVAKLKAFERMTKPTLEEPKFVAPKVSRTSPPTPLALTRPPQTPSVVTPPARQRQQPQPPPLPSQTRAEPSCEPGLPRTKPTITEVNISVQQEPELVSQKLQPSPELRRPERVQVQTKLVASRQLSQEEEEQSQTRAPPTPKQTQSNQPVRKQAPPIPNNDSQIAPLAQNIHPVAPQITSADTSPRTPNRLTHEMKQPSPAPAPAPVQAPPPDRHQVSKQHQQQQPPPRQQPQPPLKDDKNQDRTVLSVSGKKRCSSCQEELGRGAAAFVIESLNLVYHTNCFRCSVCHVNLSNGFCGVDVRVHAGALHCQNCYSKDGLNYSRV